MDAAHILGYVASALIVVAMSMTAIVHLRVIGVLGAVTMAAYGAVIGAWPVLGANVIIAVMHVTQLRRLVAKPSSFELQPIADASQWYLRRFVQFYGDDMRRTHPAFDVAAFTRVEPGHSAVAPSLQGFFVLRDMVSVGLFLYREDPAARAITIAVDYVTPRFRDLRNARFAYRELPRRIDTTRFAECRVTPSNAQMRRYFMRLGFREGRETTELALPLRPPQDLSS